MSRRGYAAGGKDVVVGWDPPMQSFYAQVYLAGDLPDFHDDEPADDFGFTGGVPLLKTLLDWLEERQLTPPTSVITRLAQDCAVDR